MQIHRLDTVRNERYVLDDELGVVMRKEQAIQPSTTTVICHEGVTYEVQADGTFHVPENVGAFFLRMPDWHAGPSPFAPEGPAASPARESRRGASK